MLEQASEEGSGSVTILLQKSIDFSPSMWYISIMKNETHPTTEKTMKFSPSENIGSSRTGTIQNITEQEIESIFGFAPNVDDDPFKVVNSWAVDVDDAHTVHVWDYKGSHRDGQFSTQGSPAVLKQIFGDRYVPGGWVW